MKSTRYIQVFVLLLTVLALQACGGGGGAAPAANSGNAGGQVGGNTGNAANAPGVSGNVGNSANAPGISGNAGNPGGGAGGPGGANGIGPGGGGAGAAIPAEGDSSDLPVDVDSILEDNDAVQIDENGNISVSVTDTQVNEALSAQSTQSTETSQIEDAEVSFTTAGIVFTGNVSGQALYILFWPYVENGTIQIDVVEATLDGMAVPDALLDEAETAVNESLSTAMGSVDVITLQSIVVTNGLLTVTGSLNQ